MTPPVNSWADSLCLLKGPSIGDRDFNVVQRGIGWREAAPGDGERWLRGAAAHGSTYAMEKLGLRLIEGDGLSREVLEGVDWLRKSAQSGSATAMERLATFLLDDEQHGNAVEGERWIRAAIGLNRWSAKVALAKRLMTGRGLSPDPLQGKELLCECARQGSGMAHITLAVCFLAGWGVSPDSHAALAWLRRIGVLNSQQVAELGFHVYMKALAQPMHMLRGLAEEAAILFREAVRQGHRAAELSLAYLIRKGEIPKAGYPSLGILLSEHLNQNNPHAVMNEALRRARGVECCSDWESADNLVREQLLESDRVFIWWSARSQEGDPEGHLVIAWLCRHALATDPDRMRLSERVALARQKGWAVPDWMTDPLSSTAGGN